MPGPTALGKRTPRVDPAATSTAATYATRNLPTYVPSSSSGRWDAERSTYNWKPSNTRKLRASLSRASVGSGLASHLFVGDSETDGYVGTGWDRANAWPRAYRATLTSLGVPVGGSGFVPAAPMSGGVSPWWTLTSFTNNNAYISTATSGATAVFASTDAGTKVDVVFYNSSAPFTVSIDGAAAVTVTPPGGLTVGKYTATGLANANHTVTITTTTASTVYILGANVYGTSGLLVHNAGRFGTSTTHWVDTASATGYSLPMSQAITPTPADVAWISLGVNDALGARTAAQYLTDMTTVATFFKNTGANVILVGQYQPSGVSAAVWEGFLASLYTVANALDLPLLDMYDRSGGYTVSNGLGLYGDGTHPNAIGLREWGRAAAFAAAR